MIRDKKSKPQKKGHLPAKQTKAEERLIFKLQAESLKVHGDPLDTPKKAQVEKE